MKDLYHPYCRVRQSGTNSIQINHFNSFQGTGFSNGHFFNWESLWPGSSCATCFAMMIYHFFIEMVLSPWRKQPTAQPATVEIGFCETKPPNRRWWQVPSETGSVRFEPVGGRLKIESQNCSISCPSQTFRLRALLFVRVEERWFSVKWLFLSFPLSVLSPSWNGPAGCFTRDCWWLELFFLWSFYFVIYFLNDFKNNHFSFYI